MSYERLGQYSGAVESLKQLLQIDPNVALGHRLLGEIYVKLDKLTLAEEAFYKAGMLFLNQGDQNELEAVLENLRQINPTSPLLSKLRQARGKRMNYTERYDELLGSESDYP